MKEVIQNIWFHKEKILLIAAILAIVSFFISDIRGVLNDYLEFQVEKKESDFLFSMKQKCREEGKKIIEQQKEENSCSYEYTYNSKLHTCLLYYNCGLGERVEDIFTNEVLISVSHSSPLINEASGVFISVEEGLFEAFTELEEFDKKKQKLFNQ